MTGGSGSDVFIYESSADSSIGLGNYDVITDFDAGGDGSGVVDQIDLSGVITGAFSYLEEAQAFTNTGSAQAFYDSNSKILQIDADGDAQVDAEMEIKLTTVTGTLDNTDFITGT